LQILIAEDNAVSRKVLETRLTKWGYDVLCATDGAEAWKMLRGADAPTLAILDWMMPGIDGVELCRRVREKGDEPYTYIILLTAKDQKEDVVHAMDAGADDYITKPPHPSELQARIRAGRRVIELQQRLFETQEALRVQATHDTLTSLWNRSAIMDVLDRELDRAKRQETPIGVAMADLDHFKNVNDSLGHMVGDTVLREVAGRLQSGVRNYDAVGRYGGEEFLIVFPGANKKDAWKAAERIRSAIGERPIALPDRKLPVTISMGVTATNPTTKTGKTETLIRLADDALYTAKARGRNRVEMSK
jgi:diguanylate cyclase (GGDEF)-like protein